ncbi:RGG repeats nuclear RNA binding protein A-like [Mercurialis annua]|uniref:RGG repeats nuclear RNA binding protein A-like n=1 Tax=Mercurialis annua TaxID=3986 RepID=UPI00215E3EEF|nr:RGG repeats nuclear RNA binding protein A-like [Mercurialis annua]
MATKNPFDLLGDDDGDDPSLLIAATQEKAAAAAAAAAAVPKKTQSQPVAKQQQQPAKLPSKPLPPSQAVKEARNEGGRGGSGGRGYGGRGRGGYNREFSNNENSFSNSAPPAAQGAPEDGDAGKTSERRSYGAPRGGYRGGRRGGFNNGDFGDDERPRRAFERRSGTGRGNEFKREGGGRGNWGTQTDELAQVTEEAVNEGEKNVSDEKPVGEEEPANEIKESPANEPEEKDPENENMTLEEYEKVLEEKRKALQSLKVEGRKVDATEFTSMQQLSNKKVNDDVFIKLGAEKDKQKEASEKYEKAKKSVSINEFLKPAEGERYYGQGGRGRGRGRGSGSRGGFSNRDALSNVAAPSIEDPGHFPTLGGK